MSTDSPTAAHPDTFGARADLTVGDRTYEIFNITAPSLAERHDVDRLPYSIKVLLENLLRHEDGPHVSADDIVAVAAWGANPEGHGQGAGDSAHEIAFTPERVLMQDFTGVPAVVDLAAMRDALANLGGDATKVNPLVPVELVIDHSVIIERSGDAEAYDTNVSIEYQRNMERYQLLRWAQGAFQRLPGRAAGHGHLPPGQPRVPVPPRVRHRGRPGLLRLAGRAPTRTRSWSTASASSAGAWAVLRRRPPCWGSPCRCCCHRSSGCALRVSPGPARRRPTWCSR